MTSLLSIPECDLLSIVLAQPRYYSIWFNYILSIYFSKVICGRATKSGGRYCGRDVNFILHDFILHNECH